MDSLALSPVMFELVALAPSCVIPVVIFDWFNAVWFNAVWFRLSLRDVAFREVALEASSEDMFAVRLPVSDPSPSVRFTLLFMLSFSIGVASALGAITSNKEFKVTDELALLIVALMV